MSAKSAPLMSPEELADELGVDKQKLAVMRMNGSGPKFFRAGRFIRYRRADVDAWIEAGLRTSTRSAA